MCFEGWFMFNNGCICLDLIFYEYEYCVCDEGFYGDNGLCKKCMSGVICYWFVINVVDDLCLNIMEVLSGYWLLLGFSNVFYLVKCLVLFVCNFIDFCVCWLVILLKVINFFFGSC